jgi:hypothetical protein
MKRRLLFFALIFNLVINGGGNKCCSLKDNSSTELMLEGPFKKLTQTILDFVQESSDRKSNFNDVLSSIKSWASKIKGLLRKTPAFKLDDKEGRIFENFMLDVKERAESNKTSEKFERENRCFDESVIDFFSDETMQREMATYILGKFENDVESTN